MFVGLGGISFLSMFRSFLGAKIIKSLLCEESIWMNVNWDKSKKRWRVILRTKLDGGILIVYFARRRHGKR